MLECKKTDGVSVKAKSEAWAKVAEEFNSINLNERRDVNSLKVFYQNTKRTIKKKAALNNVSRKMFLLYLVKL